jgi:hypothetical protein
MDVVECEVIICAFRWYVGEGSPRKIGISVVGVDVRWTGVIGGSIV